MRGKKGGGEIDLYKYFNIDDVPPLLIFLKIKT